MNTKFKIILILWRYEMIKLRRQPLMLMLLLMFLILGMYGINNGRRLALQQLSVIDSLQLIQHNNLNELIGRFKADTSTIQGKTFASQAGIPQVVEFKNPPYAINPPKALSVLAIGQRNLLPFFDLVNTKRTNLTPPDLEIINPEKLAIGNFDLAFVLIYLFPLLIVLWGHNVFSHEQEQQTDRLLKVHGIEIRLLILGKLGFRFLILSILAVLISLAGFKLSDLSGGVTIPDALLWLLAILVYLVFWFAVSLFVAQLHLPSRQNALLLLSCWLLLAIIIPAALARVGDLAYPLPSRAELDNKARAVTWDTWELSIAVQIDSFYTNNPQYETLRRVSDTAQYGNKRFAAYQDLLQRRLKRLADNYYQQVDGHFNFIHKSSWLNPVTAIEHTLTADAENTQSDYLRFEQQANVFQQRYTAFMNKYLLEGRQIKLRELAKLPMFSLQKDKHKTARLGSSLFPVIFLSLAVLAGALFIKIKN
ncbi:ABC transporter permease [Pedobacter mendelii]|uniref:ABC-2 type transport system permease protein n=1 Tax=Pedobacter mendelii TaxID=1908240 RepID=A0ABQ2BFE7_9SPHI|nr:ABC transporter permease subunit [Pedobacter mendelii]GGI23307.1 hypothetical protein GCM10008119_06990 [Pedobacter mendelii]